ncbi:MAG: hypothetical protein O2992_09370 [Gemmatimonadetes bacterium]|nr:hypothetical protein [Gemmatimonadota bacterium]
MLLVLLAAGGCSSGEANPEASSDASVFASAAVATAPTLAAATAIGLTNAKMPLPGLVTGGQPTPQQLAALREAGFNHFVSLRPAAEDGAGWEETTVGAPSTFARIAVAGGSGLTRENVEALERLLAQYGDEPTVLYCASSNRVGALLALRAAWLEDMPAAEALSLGRAAGMRSLEPAVTELLGGG